VCELQSLKDFFLKVQDEVDLSPFLGLRLHLFGRRIGEFFLLSEIFLSARMIFSEL